MEDDIRAVRRSDRIAASRKLSDDIRDTHISHKKYEFDTWFGSWVDGKSVLMTGVNTEYDFYMRELPILLNFQKMILVKYREAEEDSMNHMSAIKYNPSAENIAKRAAAEEYRKYIHVRIRELYCAIRRARDAITPAPVALHAVSMNMIDEGDANEEYAYSDANANDGILDDILKLCNGFENLCSVENSPIVRRMSNYCEECSDIDL
jgi:hypothetical protein